MSLTWAKFEIAERAREEAEAQTPEAYAAMKRRWADRRRAEGYSRSQARALLEQVRQCIE
jgi:hypothetical protein